MDEDKLEGYKEAIRLIKEWQKLGKETEWLYLTDLNLTSLPEEITELKKLQGLSLAYNSFTELPDEIFKLKELKGLYLDNNKLKEIPTQIADLKDVKVLSLSHNKFEKFPDSIAALSEVQVLYLNNNHLLKISKEISKLRNIHKLYLNNNKLTEFPAEIAKLKNLQFLSLSHNLIEELPKEISELVNLNVLYFNHNNLKQIPKEITKLNKIKELHLFGNLELNIPNIIIVKDDEPQKILNYYFENSFKIDDEQLQPLKEVKVLLVGQGRVGKTSLVKSLVEGKRCNHNEESTHGIFRTPWKLNIAESETREIYNVQLNLWDFGGQDIMHATHEFFLTERSLYLLVLDAGLSKEANRLEYWLKKIQTYSQNSPIFIVINKSEANKLEIPLKTLQEEYNIHGLFEVSCEDGFNINILEEKIKEQIGKMSEVFRRVNKNWFSVKDELENLKLDYISIDDYREICLKHNVTDLQSQDTLLSYLHELGIVLNFKEDNTKVLNPEWVTRGVYKLITSIDIHNNKAVLTPELLQAEMESLNDELKNDGKPYLSYPLDKYEYLINLMKKFELCYEIQGTKNFYIPGRLEEDKPEDIGDWNEKECLGFRYEYGKGFLHESVMTRFIVKMHRKIFNKKQWLTGVVLINENGNKALIRADITQGFIKILINGKEATRREFLAVIRNNFQDIHFDIKVNKPIEQVPLVEYPEKFVEYEKLLQLENANIIENYEAVDGKLIKVNVDKLLNGITTSDTREEDRMTYRKLYEEEKKYKSLFQSEHSKIENIGVSVVLYTKEKQLKYVKPDYSMDDFTELKKLEGQLEIFSKQADSIGSKKALGVIIFSIIIHFSFFMALIYFIFIFPLGGWDKAESWTFAIFVGLEIINTLGYLLFFIRTRKDFSWAAFCEWMISRQKSIIYLRNESIDEKIEALKLKLNEYQNRKDQKEL